MADELRRNGDDTRGSTDLRRPSLEDKVPPPIPVPALFADCGVFNRLWIARLRPDLFELLWVADDEVDGDRRGTTSACSSSGVKSED